MENTGNEQTNRVKENQVRQPYHAPQLILLGEIQSIIQSKAFPGNDGTPCGFNCAVS
jgi:hypothetical protein